MTSKIKEKLLGLLDIFVCPECKTKLVYEEKQLWQPHRRSDVFVYYLKCNTCNIKYPIIEGIPRFDQIYEFPEGDNSDQFMEAHPNE